MKNLSELVQRAKLLSGKKISLAGAAEVDSLLAIEMARAEGIADAILVGDEEQIRICAKEAGVDVSTYEIVHEPKDTQISKIAVKKIIEGKADALMKGLVGTADFMKAILDKENGLIGGGLLSHIALFEVPTYPKLLCITDVAINIAPSLSEKVTMINNAVAVMRMLGVEKPKVACLCAVEKVNPGKMPCTEDAAILSGMNRTGQIENCYVDGPLALDNAIDPDAAKLKKIHSTVAGEADILLCPDIVSANILYKSLAYLAKCDCGAITIGTSAPVVLTSRADSDKTKFVSIALAIAASK